MDPLDYSAAAAAVAAAAAGDEPVANRTVDLTQHPPSHHKTMERVPPIPPLVRHLRIFHLPTLSDSNSSYPMSLPRSRPTRKPRE